MTELEIIQHAKSYLDKMAEGIDPITGSPVADTDCIRQVRIFKCLIFVSGILQKVIENGGAVGRTSQQKLEDFSISKEQLQNYTFDVVPISVSAIAKKINDLVDTTGMVKLNQKSISSFLLEQGWITEEEDSSGHRAKVPTERGRTIGISREVRTGINGTPYSLTVYNGHAQRFILEHLDPIIEINSTLRSKPDAPRMQFQRWTDEQDGILVNLFKRNVPVAEIASAMKRSRTAIMARLVRLGLIEDEQALPASEPLPDA